MNIPIIFHRYISKKKCSSKQGTLWTNSFHDNFCKLVSCFYNNVFVFLFVSLMKSLWLESFNYILSKLGSPLSFLFLFIYNDPAVIFSHFKVFQVYYLNIFIFLQIRVASFNIITRRQMLCRIAFLSSLSRNMIICDQLIWICTQNGCIKQGLLLSTKNVNKEKKS